MAVRNWFRVGAVCALADDSSRTQRTESTMWIPAGVNTMDAAPRSSERIAPLWGPAYEHDSCGVGLVVDIAGRPSREIVERALAGLVNLTHRGGVGADSRTGDGAGVLTQIPLALFSETLAAAGHSDLDPGELGVAMTFLPVDEDSATPRESARASRSRPWA